MSSLDKASLYICIANFKFSHTFVICDRLPKTNILYSIDIWREGSFFTYTRNSEQQHHIAVVKSTFKIPPRHNGIIQITIEGHNLKVPTGYFISNQHINWGLDPNIRVIDGIYNTKGRSSLHILVANCTNKHVTFNKGHYIGHIEPSIDYIPQTSTKCLTTQKMIDEHSQPDNFTPSLHTLLGAVMKSLNQLLEIFKSQLVQDVSIGTTHLTKMQIDTGNSEPVLQRP